MKNIFHIVTAFILLALLTHSVSFGQANTTPFASTTTPRPDWYAKTNNGLWVDSAVKLVSYRMTGDTVLIGCDATGKLYRITKSMIQGWSTGGGGGTGTVTAISVVTANGVSGTVANPTTTPAITFTLGAITPTSVNGVSATIIGFLNGVTSNIQTQLNGKLSLSGGSMSGGIVLNNNGLVDAGFISVTNGTAHSTINASGVTTDRSLYLPDQDGTIAVTTDIPAQVNIIGGTGISVTGTYPNKTITATGLSADSTVFATVYRVDTAKQALRNSIALKQDALVSGTNIKTVNSNSLVGSGNVSVGTVTGVTATPPLASTGGTSPDLSIANAAADGSTKGAASFSANDFNSSSGNVSIDYTNGQVSTNSVPGFLSAADHTTFSAKESALTFSAPLNRSGNTISLPAASTSAAGYLSATDWNTFNNKQGALNLTTGGSSGPATLVGNTLNIPQYSGGGSSTSLDSLRIAGTIPIVDSVFNEFFSGGSLPTGWLKGSALTTSYTGGFLTVTGSGNWTYSTAGVTTSALPNAMAYNLQRAPWEDLDFIAKVVVTTMTDSSVIAFTRQTNGFNFSNTGTIAYDLSNRGTQGRAKVGSGAIWNFNTSASDSAGRTPLIQGDTVLISFHKSGWNATTYIKNLRTGKETPTNFQFNLNDQGGMINLVFGPGVYQVFDAKLSTNARIGGVQLWGNSILSGTGESSESVRWANLLMYNNYRYFNVIGSPSISAKYWDIAGNTQELLNRGNPDYVIVSLGYNDAADHGIIADYKKAIDSIGTQITRAGKPFAFVGLVPKNSTTDVYDDTLKSLCTQRGWTYVNTRAVLADANGRLKGVYCYDGVHLNDLGAQVLANQVIAAIGLDVRKYFARTTTSPVKINYLPVARAENIAAIVGWDKDGSLVSVPNGMANAFSYVKNQRYTGVSGNVFPFTTPQDGSIDMLGPVSTSSFYTTDSKPLRMLFHDYSSTASWHDVIDITNCQDESGLNYRGYDSISGSRVVVISAQKSAKGYVSGSKITAINSVLNSDINTKMSGSNVVLNNTSSSGSLSTASNLFLYGDQAGRGRTTAGNAYIAEFSSTAPSYNTPNMIHIGMGDVSMNNKGAAAGDVSLCPSSGTVTIYVGGLSTNSDGKLRFPGANGNNHVGVTGYIMGGAATGNATPGIIRIQTSQRAASSGTEQATYNDQMAIDEAGVAIGNVTGGTLTRTANVGLDVQSTTQGVLLTPKTAIQEAAISSPATGLIGFNTDLQSYDVYNGSVWTSIGEIGKKVTTQVNATTTTLANITNQSVNVQAAGVYAFEAVEYVTADAVGGYKFAIGGTATASSIIYDVQDISTAYVAPSRQTSMGSAYTSATGATTARVTITGTITVNAAGTLTVQFAQGAANGTSSVLVGSIFKVQKL